MQTFLRNRTLPHALLFTGMEGVGKRTAARVVAMALNCRDKSLPSDNPCGKCRSCRQILSNNHPDIPVIEPQGNYLRIDQIRKLLGTLTMKPFSAEHRVVIIAQAQAMNPEAANALLKILEEPPRNTVLILTALQTSDLLPTIVSRCRHLRFNPLSPQDIVALLKESSEITDESAKRAATLSEGSLTKARQLSMTVWQERRNWLIRAAGLAQRPEHPDGRRSMAMALTFAAQLAQKKDQIQALLEILKTWIRDLCIFPYHPGLLINGDHRRILEDVRSAIDDRALLAMWSAVEKAQKDIAAKANLRLTLDVMALSMAGYMRQ